MKLEYSKPRFQIIEFEKADILTASPITPPVIEEPTTDSSDNNGDLTTDDIYDIK